MRRSKRRQGKNKEKDIDFFFKIEGKRGGQENWCEEREGRRTGVRRGGLRMRNERGENRYKKRDMYRKID